MGSGKVLKQGSHWQQGGNSGGCKSGSGTIPVRIYVIDEDPK